MSLPSVRRALALALLLPALPALAACGADAPSGTTRVPEPTIDTVGLAVATSLPTLRVETAGGVAITSRDTYLNATYALVDTLGATQASGATEIRGRGNSTWDLFPKKPFRVRLATSTSLFGFPASRHWVLLANYSDKTLVRTDVAFELSRRMGFPWTPRSQHVTLMLNGVYEGIYQLVEHVRVAPDRVNVPELRVGDTTAALITGGYFLEVDETRDGDFCFGALRTTMIFCDRSPETLHLAAWQKQRDYLVDYVRRTEDAIFGPAFADPALGYAAFLDVPSMIDYYLLEEVVKNVDSNLRRGTYLYKPRGGKLFFGPVWDFDIAFGNVNYDGADAVVGWHTRKAAWYQRLFEDPGFDAAVKARWRALRADGTIDAAVRHAGVRAAYLSRVQALNFTRWPILGSHVWPNRVVTGTYPGELEAMQGWMRARIAWMDSQLGP